MSEAEIIGRFAPSPTGPLHFGSLVAAVGSYCLARQGNGRWLLRMEDLDPPRVVPGAADEILAALEACGLFWDDEIVWQSQRGERYAAVMESLQAKGLIYQCACTRRQVLSVAGTVGDDGPVYPGTCREGMIEGARPRTLRIRVPEKSVTVADGVFGVQSQNLARSVGDFILRRADGLFAYQLAVVVDDADAGVNQVVRGADLLSSTPRQVYLHNLLGCQVPEYYHLPLAVDDRGKKLSKQQGADAVDYRTNAAGLISEALLFLGQELPAELFGATAAEQLCWAVQHFDQSRIPTRSQRYNSLSDRW